MTYVLGTATATGAPLRLQNTVQGDGWTSLANAYGVTPQAIWAMQPELKGKTLNTPNLEAFIQSRPGWSRERGQLAFVASNNPAQHGGKPGEGWSLFTNETQLMLPDMPRLDGKGPAVRGPLISDDGVNEAGMGVGALIFGLATAALFLSGRKKKKKPSPAAVKF